MRRRNRGKRSSLEMRGRTKTESKSQGWYKGMGGGQKTATRTRVMGKEGKEEHEKEKRI